MLILLWIAATLAAAIHVMIFAMESLWWDRPAIRRRFRMDEAQANATRLFAFNQGFYNLFLALGIAVGLALLVTGRHDLGLLLVCWNALSMLAAAVVLVASSPRMLRGALIQGVPALLTVAAAAFLVLTM